MVFRRAKRLDAFSVSAGGFIDIFRHAGGADKADGGNTRVGIKLLGIFIAAMNDVKNAVRQTGFFQ